MLQNIELKQALELIRQHASPIEETEYLPLFKAVGMILAEDIAAAHDQPPFDRSPLDGYAVRSQDIGIASRQNPVPLEIIDEICAGMCSQKTVVEGCAVRIMTGAPLPKGADCVIRQEATERYGCKVMVYESQKHYDNVCFQGEDYKKGQILLRKGERLDAVKLGILSGNGEGNVAVYRLPRVAVVTTGDEICRRGDALTPGKIYDTNCQMLSGRVMELGCEAYGCEVLGDDAGEVCSYINKIIGHVDCVITVGALSVGVKDIMHEVIDQLGAEKVFHRVRLKPGSPVSFAMLRDKPILSLSGNPFAALATFEVLARPMLASLRQDDSLRMVRATAVMAAEFRKKSKTRRFLRASFEEGKIYLKGGDSSGILSSMAGCNCLLDIPAGSEGLEPGETVELLLL